MTGAGERKRGVVAEVARVAEEEAPRAAVEGAAGVAERPAAGVVESGSGLAPIVSRAVGR